MTGRWILAMAAVLLIAGCMDPGAEPQATPLDERGEAPTRSTNNATPPQPGPADIQIQKTGWVEHPFSSDPFVVELPFLVNETASNMTTRGGVEATYPVIGGSSA